NMTKGSQFSKNSCNAFNKDVKLRYPDNKQYTPDSFKIKNENNKELRQFKKRYSSNNNYTPTLMRELEILKNTHNRKLQDFSNELENQRDLKHIKRSKTIPYYSEQQKPQDYGCYSMQYSNLHTLPCYYSANCEFSMLVDKHLWLYLPEQLAFLEENNTNDMNLENQYFYDIANIVGLPSIHEDS
ncbi:20218_t:CDS:2, partial [Dentiscutata erythropus]